MVPAAAPTALAPSPERVPLLRRRLTLPSITACVAVFALGLRQDLVLNISLGTVVAAGLAPVWVPALRRVKGARTLVLLTVISVLTGWWLTEIAATDHATSQRLLVATCATAINMALGTGLVVWARHVVPPGAVAIAFGLGMLAGTSTGGRYAESPWRFGFGVPVTIIVLGAALLIGRRWLEVSAGLLLAAVSAVAGGRSMFAILAFAAVLTWWFALPRARGKRGSSVRVALLLVLSIPLAYQAGQALILEGYLGEGAKARTELQIQMSGSVLLGARPEMAATAALMAERPMGYGAGTSANAKDLLVAKTGMAKLGYDPDNGYVERYMFGTAMELHSGIGDLWVLYGIPGLALALWIGWLIARGAIAQLAARRPQVLALFLGLTVLWNLAFGPFYSTSPLFAIALGLLVLPSRSPRAGAAGRRRYSA